MSFNPKGALMCCRRCGRDTRARDGMCAECGGHSSGYMNQPKRRGSAIDRTHAPLEDDYGDESTADSIYRERDNEQDLT
jgi:ribosomal protein L37E